jgi:hypothetical protein
VTWHAARMQSDYAGLTLPVAAKAAQLPRCAPRKHRGRAQDFAGEAPDDKLRPRARLGGDEREIARTEEVWSRQDGERRPGACRQRCDAGCNGTRKPAAPAPGQLPVNDATVASIHKWSCTSVVFADPLQYLWKDRPQSHCDCVRTNWVQMQDARLENRQGRKPLVSSNLTLSAMIFR